MSGAHPKCDETTMDRLFLVTRDSQPNLPQSAAALVNEVNFTVTRAGLEGKDCCPQGWLQPCNSG